VREGACIGGATMPALDIEVDPRRCCFGSRQSDFALQAVVECRRLNRSASELLVCDDIPAAVKCASVSRWACRKLCVCFITAGPITKLFAWGGRRVEDMCYERRRAEACVDESAHHALGPVRNPVL
jgi:hypothetical protein